MGEGWAEGGLGRGTTEALDICKDEGSPKRQLPQEGTLGGPDATCGSELGVSGLGAPLRPCNPPRARDLNPLVPRAQA